MYAIAVGNFQTSDYTDKQGKPARMMTFQAIFPAVKSVFLPRGYAPPAPGLYLVTFQVGDSGKFTNWTPLTVNSVSLADAEKTLQKAFPLSPQK